MEKETNRAAGVAAPGAEDAEELSSTSTSVDNLTSPVSPDTGSTTPVIVPARENLQPQVEDEVQDEKEKEAGLDKEEDVVPTGKLPGIIQPQYPGVKTAESPRTTTFPQLSNNPLASPLSRPVNIGDDKDEESSVPKSFDRSAKRSPAIQHTTRKEIFENDEGVRRMYKFTLYETTMRYYIVGADLLDARFRILKIDRTADIGDLSIIEDEVVYTKEEMTRLLATIEDGNIINGGLKHRCPFWGLLGFIRFTGAYYMILVTKRNVVAMIGGHYVYQIDGTELVPLTTINTSKKAENNPEEARFVGILGNLDLTRSFYFSYSYDITHTLQHNISREREAIAKGLARPGTHEHNDMFAWNHYLLQPACLHVKNVFDWCLPIIHGYVDQATISVYGRIVYITIIARRSRHFAGARFLKRGANDLGYVANDVETEQIVSEMLTTSFHAPGYKLYASPNYTSYVQHRGSIPLFWTQENNAAIPKPPIELNLIDPFFSAAALHFDDMFKRYGTPVIVLNLVKSKERTPRESILLNEFTQAISYLNQFLPKPDQIHYIAWDMSRASKSRDQDVIETLEEISEKVLNITGFFHNGSNPENPPQMQNGVCRTNCIDCLDRTNAAQFVIGKRALGRQLQALGVIKEKTIEYDTDAVNLFTHMYHDHGDTIAVQYAGSHLVNTMATYRKINQWTSQPRDMLESFKRYYNNSFLDAQRQEAINLFLGNYIFAQGQPMLWDLTTDYYLHHVDPRQGRRRRSYKKWWTTKHLEKRVMPESPLPVGQYANNDYAFFDDYWLEYYRPRAVSSFAKVFSYNLNSAFKYIPLKMTQEGKYDLSPFKIRIPHTESVSSDPRERSRSRRRRKSVKLIANAGVDAPSDIGEESAEEGEIEGNENRRSEAQIATLNTAESQLKRISLRGFPQGWTASPDALLQAQEQQQPHQPVSNTSNNNPYTYQNFQSSFETDAVINAFGRNNAHTNRGPIHRTNYTNLPSTTHHHRSSSLIYGPYGTGSTLTHPYPPLSATTSTITTTTGTTTTTATTNLYQQRIIMSQLPIDEVVFRLLNPSVSTSDADEYSRYMSHPLNLPLVVSTDLTLSLPQPHQHSSSHPSTIHNQNSIREFVSYVNSVAPATPSAEPNLVSATYKPKPEDVYLYEQFLSVPENALSVEQSDGSKKRYKAYQTWLNTGRLKGGAGAGGGMGMGLGGGVCPGRGGGSGVRQGHWSGLGIVKG